MVRVAKKSGINIQLSAHSDQNPPRTHTFAFLIPAIFRIIAVTIPITGTHIKNTIMAYAYQLCAPSSKIKRRSGSNPVATMPTPNKAAKIEMVIMPSTKYTKALNKMVMVRPAKCKQPPRCAGSGTVFEAVVAAWVSFTLFLLYMLEPQVCALLPNPSISVWMVFLILLMSTFSPRISNLSAVVLASGSTNHKTIYTKTALGLNVNSIKLGKSSNSQN